MKTINADEPISFEEASLPNSPYSFFDDDNKLVTVNVPVPENHTPHDSIIRDPAVFQNAGFAVKHCSRKEVKESNKHGDEVTYECDNFLQKINHPCQITKPNLSLAVAIHYGTDGQNFTRTIYDIPGGIS